MLGAAVVDRRGRGPGHAVRRPVGVRPGALPGSAGGRDLHPGRRRGGPARVVAGESRRGARAWPLVARGRDLGRRRRGALGRRPAGRGAAARGPIRAGVRAVAAGGVRRGRGRGPVPRRRPRGGGPVEPRRRYRRARPTGPRSRVASDRGGRAGRILVVRRGAGRPGGRWFARGTARPDHQPRHMDDRRPLVRGGRAAVRDLRTVGRPAPRSWPAVRGRRPLRLPMARHALLDGPRRGTARPVRGAV